MTAPGIRRTTTRGRLGVTVTDQVLASAAWYVPVLFVGRAADPREFGVFLVAYGALALAVSVSRGMFGVVLGMDVAPGSAVEPRNAGLTVGGIVVWASGSAAVLAAAAWLVPRGGALVALLALAALPVMLQDLARYHAVAAGSPARALLADTVWLVPCLVGLGADLLQQSTMSARSGMGLWLASCVVGLGVSICSGLVAPARFAGLWGWWRRDARRRHLAGDSVLSGLVPVANGWGAALVAGPLAVASVRGAAVLFAPVATLMLAMTLVAVPEAHRRRPGEAVRLLTGLTGLLVVAALVWGGLVLATQGLLGRAVLGASWEVARPVAPLVCLEYVGLALWAGGTALLRYASATRAVLRIRLLYAPAAVLLPVVALALGDDPRYFAAALALLAWLIGGLALVRGLRAVRR